MANKKKIPWTTVQGRSSSVYVTNHSLRSNNPSLKIAQHATNMRNQHTADTNRHDSVSLLLIRKRTTRRNKESTGKSVARTTRQPGYLKFFVIPSIINTGSWLTSSTKGAAETGPAVASNKKKSVRSFHLIKNSFGVHAT